MYTLSKGPSKILAKTRRGLTQKVDSLESPRDFASKRPGELNGTADMSSPKPVFQQVNGRRSYNQKSSQDTITPQHEEIMRYIHDSWKLVSREYEAAKQPGAEGKVNSVVYYQDNCSTSQLPKFEPFDLELFWGQRVIQSITQST
ncbi:MAPK regulated corepressor interacting protein 2-like isoform X1 [Limulus polyphemus]|uniref:MAPK regulated corepressor interacting protein 2-like isoform X1 n=1 Tax=Limulus polyphemus TaxID=6850 RepID=A0ABM1B1I8_LIMPO|nr:MAPK regulated corepressor interacting protein 2-like isoform X1 [Limulus polyphemus]